MISAVIPAFNEEKRIGSVLEETSKYVDEIIVVDDASTDNTSVVAEKYAKVLKNKKNRGYIYSIKKGFRHAKHEIIVTLDADGEHNPADIPRLTKPVIQKQRDLVLGVRKTIPRISERFINKITNLKVKTMDCGTGFRVIRKELATKLELKGACTCGIFVLEAHMFGARIEDVNIKTREINKKRGIALKHIKQLFIILKWLIWKH